MSDSPGTPEPTREDARRALTTADAARAASARATTPSVGSDAILGLGFALATALVVVAGTKTAPSSPVWVLAALAIAVNYSYRKRAR